LCNSCAITFLSFKFYRKFYCKFYCSCDQSLSVIFYPRLMQLLGWHQWHGYWFSGHVSWLLAVRMQALRPCSHRDPWMQEKITQEKITPWAEKKHQWHVGKKPKCVCAFINHVKYVILVHFWNLVFFSECSKVHTYCQ